LRVLTGQSFQLQYQASLTFKYRAIESKTHGNVLWAPLDHAATRIGFAYTEEIAAKYPGGVTQEVAEKEALESMKPFDVRFKEIHWWTLYVLTRLYPESQVPALTRLPRRYTIGQKMAKDFATRDRIILCGDAAHTHSSGAAQGLNTGIHDAVNLGWKLALQIRGITKPEILKTYNDERKLAVNQLIEYDKDIAVLMTHKWPKWYEGDPNADPYIILGEIFEKARSFNTGLGISYPINAVNQTTAAVLNVVPGSRPPDVELTMPGTGRKLSLQDVTPNLAKFWVVVFAGNPVSTKESLLSLRDFLEERDQSFLTREYISWITISAINGYSPYETLGTKPFGDTFFDTTSSAHEKFGFGLERGGILILRPDGLVAHGGPINGQIVENYFTKLFRN
jgi:phenol 2-monooxygenase (NADPH)